MECEGGEEPLDPAELCSAAELHRRNKTVPIQQLLRELKALKRQEMEDGGRVWTWEEEEELIRGAKHSSRSSVFNSAQGDQNHFIISSVATAHNEVIHSHYFFTFTLIFPTRSQSQFILSDQLLPGV